VTKEQRLHTHQKAVRTQLSRKSEHNREGGDHCSKKQTKQTRPKSRNPSKQETKQNLMLSSMRLLWSLDRLLASREETGAFISLAYLRFWGEMEEPSQAD
jgi:hypothetical protein